LFPLGKLYSGNGVDLTADNDLTDDGAHYEHDPDPDDDDDDEVHGLAVEEDD